MGVNRGPPWRFITLEIFRAVLTVGSLMGGRFAMIDTVDGYNLDSLSYLNEI